MKITIPELSLVVLIGASGAGKSTFARQHFQQFEVISSDFCRGLVSNDENSQSASRDAFDVLHYITTKRLAAGKLTVIDATNVQPEDRKTLLQMAKQYHCFAVAIVFDLPEELCHERNQQRSDRQFGSHVVRRHTQMLRRSLRGLEKEGFRYVHTLKSPEEIANVEIELQPLWNNKKHEHGPFDIIGDIHGCCDELEALLQQLGYEKSGGVENTVWNAPTYYHPQGRKAVFLGDLVDRGTRILDTVKLVRNMVTADTAICVPGNHENKLLRKLRGKNVKASHGLQQTLDEIAALPEAIRTPFTKELTDFLDSLISHYLLDDGRLVVAHAGMKQEMQGRGSGAVREFALYGESTGEIDEFGLPVRYNWAGDYRGEALVVYGHTPIPEAEWLNNTIDIDTGCVFGGKLTALRYPEKELVSVPAARVYCEPVKPLVENIVTRTSQQEFDDVLNIEDVLGKRIINTKLQPNITIREENAIAALEIMSRFAANPKWLIYLPPTMSPVETSSEPGYLEHPSQAFVYYQKQGITEVICEEKHMGSRAIVVVCRDLATAEKRFGVVDEGIGICYTRTGRRFFDEPGLETQLLARVNAALTASKFWETFNTDWVCLDCELMPWSAKAQGLIKGQYAPVGVASRLACNDAVELLQQASDRGLNITTQLTHYQQRAEMANQYITAYRRYCWNVTDIGDLKLAPFHILATEKAVHIDKDHRWHIEQITQICQSDPDLLLPTAYKVIDLTDPSSQAEGVHWWEKLTQVGGEGMVVKPMQFLVKGSRGIVQPAVKCRGQEYLRIIYGPEYSAPENLQRLRQRGLSLKRSLAMREFALGVEALERFVTHAPLRHVHECVFGILALESEPVDPRL
ncbi:polynucleotide 2',3'-cyclic phosphate phosphodiesterase / polynucleotide 5'-hydroxyl-kinase / polynucleotide 3'-phosphatase [Trichormus variabilis ATCC 29413]|uniref:Polynucleotide 2',3'-cyclic phosphate phosphodiesterase / polynucleotide 5'-hydroxyl-kinase / polynucleotide 3'-phosphatase n=2 Tax=Anabaena variabilis TaxID=264691 RepID=Q3MCS0_TRIV2|nr:MULTISPECIES: polynucleotide kinase-phosphatase [Nostocaceae]ABA21216.1 polynucleotide 2',3'-cyclic phosphate phosphodiesterase / polynucleotide 5'-hydroxyl-kinase / polynucleotide 3'-phosphatase [Trichormus variabilis ATCC 29413]MBC1217123.1 polynucleotide kinase-phosphatase [Trichormus variabilis ARAD]MBC1256701.1 polynucleotide kinase-phosphatase [Trichormus variabilis V5]MBC1267796.1 polynucleotide kinase-phosphatase [Trichormus variabilis FSR]MBC1303902.1 polynucleotide kinase-phosphat